MRCIPTADINKAPIAKYSVPSVILLNVMSLTPKIDEVVCVVKQNQCDMVAITETCLKDSIPDSSAHIEGYQLFRRNRNQRDHGGVCLYIKNNIKCKVLFGPYNEVHEVFRAMLQPKRLPRGFSSIIVRVLHHPPDANSSEMLDYLRTSLEHIEANYAKCGIILSGDF